MKLKDLPQKNLAVELLNKLINDELKVRSMENVIGSTFICRYARANHKKRYHNKTKDALEIIRRANKISPNH